MILRKENEQKSTCLIPPYTSCTFVIRPRTFFIIIFLSFYSSIHFISNKREQDIEEIMEKVFISLRRLSNNTSPIPFFYLLLLFPFSLSSHTKHLRYAFPFAFILLEIFNLCFFTLKKFLVPVKFLNWFLHQCHALSHQKSLGRNLILLLQRRLFKIYIFFT